MTKEEIFNNITIQIDYIDRKGFKKIFLGNIQLSLNFSYKDILYSKVFNIKCDDWYQLKYKVVKQINKFIEKIKYQCETIKKKNILDEIQYIKKINYTEYNRLLNRHHTYS